MVLGNSPWKVLGALGYSGIFAIFGNARAEAHTLTATLWADEAYSVYTSTSEVVDGTLFLEGIGGAEDPQTGLIPLVVGVTNYLHIRVKNDGGDACALIGSFTVGEEFVFSNNISTAITLLETNHWRMSRNGFGPPYEYIQDLGSNGTSPWGTKDISGLFTRYIGSEEGPGDHYFSLVISPKNFDTSGSRYEYAILQQPIGGEAKNHSLPQVGVFEDGTNRAMSVADPGRVGVRAESAVDAANRNDVLLAEAEFLLRDYVFIGPGNEPTVDVSLNLILKGNLTAGAGNSELPTENSKGSTRLSLLAQVNEDTPFVGDVLYEASQAVISKNPGTHVGSVISGFLEPILIAKPSGDAGDFQAEYNLDIDEMLTTPVYTVPTGEPIQVKLEIVGTTTASSDGGRAMADIQFTGGWHFPYQGPVFNLPDGYTVTALSSSVVDNRFEGGGDGGGGEEPDKVLVPGLFMQADGYPGESQHDGREEWIELQEVSNGLSRLAGGRRGSLVTFEEVELIKLIDKSSPKLIEALVKGIVIEDLTILQDTQVAEDLWSRFKFLLSNAQVSGYEILGAEKETVPLEALSLDYEKIDWIYELCNSEGVGQGRVEANWDLVTGTGGSSSSSGDNEPPGMDPVGNQDVGVGSENTVDIVIEDTETDENDLLVSVSTNRPDLISDLKITGTGANRQISFKTSSLFSGFAPISVTVSDGMDSRTTAIPILVDVDMTPYEGYIASYFDEDERDDIDLTSPIRDPDKDNMPTVIEYLLGLNPMEYNRPSEAIQVAFNLDGENCNCTLDFNKRLDDPNVQGFFWVSDNMKDWTRMDLTNPLYEEDVVEGQNPLFGEAKATIAFPDVCKEPKFIRFQVTDVF